MSQVATARKLAIRNERVKVTAHFHEQGSILQGTRQGRCDGFEVEILLDSDEPAEKLSELMRLSHSMCFTEAALLVPAPVTSHHTVNGQPFEINFAPVAGSTAQDA
ncbi:MAG TPA: hypothetical protein VGJ97_12790 [Anaerolineaceae bacterium]